MADSENTHERRPPLDWPAQAGRAWLGKADRFGPMVPLAREGRLLTWFREAGAS